VGCFRIGPFMREHQVRAEAAVRLLHESVDLRDAPIRCADRTEGATSLRSQSVTSLRVGSPLLALTTIPKR
jgi:hypothetical protein